MTTPTTAEVVVAFLAGLFVDVATADPTPTPARPAPVGTRRVEQGEQLDLLTGAVPT